MTLYTSLIHKRAAFIVACISFHMRSNDTWSSAMTMALHFKPVKCVSDGHHSSKMAFLTAPEESIVVLTAPVKLVTDIVVVGLWFANASKTFKAFLPPQNEFLSPVQGILQSVRCFVHSPATKLLHQQSITLLKTCKSVRCSTIADVLALWKSRDASPLGFMFCSRIGRTAS
jgi:hypothetical protein